ncbi:MAG: hypothetical protein OXC11_04885 [Rhodospirillales bacterium]|nr:hypothetical protein [Rhodospirillales bacterium]
MMMYEWISLENPAIFRLGDRTLTLRFVVPPRGDDPWLRVEAHGGGVLELLNAVDAGQTVDHPGVWVIRGDDPAKAVTFGGENAYRFSADLEPPDLIPTYREDEFDEFWYTQMLSVRDNAVVVVYEGGVLRVDADTSLAWHIKKIYNHYFEAQDGEELVFVMDGEPRFAVNIDSGDIKELE